MPTIRVDETYRCPECDSDMTYQPTYNRRACRACGHRDAEPAFAAHGAAPCAHCEATAVLTHVDTDAETATFTCRSCYGQTDRDAGEADVDLAEVCEL